MSSGAWAVQPSEAILPRTVQGYISIRNADDFETRWQKTQIGQLLADDTMQPFIADVRTQIEKKWDVLNERLAVTFDELREVASGEVSVAIIDLPGEAAAVAMTIDVSGSPDQAAKLLKTVDDRFTKRGAKKETVREGNVDLLIYQLPLKENQKHPQQTVYFLHENMLCAVDNRAEGLAIRRRFSGAAKDNLASLTNYKSAMERCRREAKSLEPDVRWFADPFGLIWAVRKLNDAPVLPGQQRDVAKIFHDQGFDAIKSVAGFVNLPVDGEVDWLNRVVAYAPPVPGKEHDAQRWNLAMRMLQLPNASTLTSQLWVPEISADYVTLNIDVPNAFDRVEPLFDSLAGYQDAFKTTMEGLEKDPYGPQINVRNEFVAHLGTRVSMLTYYVMPITTDCERSLFAIEARDETKLAESLAKIMGEDPDVKPHDFEQFRIWERIPPEEQIETLQISALTSDDTFGQDSEASEEDEPVLPRSAVCVAKGHLFIASDIDFLKGVLTTDDADQSLLNAADYQQTVSVMEQFVSGDRSGWSFARTDETLRPAYELIRQGKMPESETLLGRMLNELLKTEAEEEEGLSRKQLIDGSKLPNFEQIRRYFGPAGRVLRSEPDGWILTEVVLDKEAP
jgi:hypothetical protein